MFARFWTRLFFSLASVPVFYAALTIAAAYATASLFAPESARAAASTQILTKRGTPVLITASSMFGDSEKQTVELSGNVQMTFDGQSLRADQARMDKKSGRIIAEGNLILASPTAYVEGARAEISYEDNTGVIYDGFVKSGQVIFQGKIINKVGIDKYEAKQASYTACTTCPPAWSFSGSQIDAEIGAYAYIKSAWFYLGGFRFFWLPYLIVPLKSERQTGVLFPSYELDPAGGYAIGVPFFWAISRSQDMTITPKYYNQRGFKTLVNYRYILNEDSTGELTFGGFLKDAIFSGTNINTEGAARFPGAERAGRWFLNHDHLYTLPGGFINRAKLNLVSDLRYTRDFPEDMKGLGDPALENRLSLTKNTELMHSSIEAAYYLNQLKSDPLDGNSESVHRFPELKQSGIERNLFSRVFLKWDFNYVNFAREDFAFDDVVLNPASATNPKSVDRARGRAADGTLQTGTGTFEPLVDVIRTGQRLDLRPELSAPFRVGKYLDILPTLQLRHTQYSFNVTAPTGSFDPLPSRQYIRGRIALRTQIARVYEGENNEPPLTADGEDRPATDVRAPAQEGSQTGIFQALQALPTPKYPTRLKHEIEPEVSVSGIPWLQETSSPFFGENASTPIYMENQPISNSDFYSKKGIQFDYDDRITQRNLVSMLVTNRFTRKSWIGDQPVYRQIVSIKNGTNYELGKPNKDGSAANFSDVFTIIDAQLEHFDTNTAIRYFPLHKVFNTSSRARVTDSRGNFFQISFSQNYLITETVTEAYTARDENIGFALGFVSRYATASGELNYQPRTYSPLDLRLKNWSALLNLRPPGNCWGIRLNVVHVLSEPSPRYTFGFDYIFGGAT